MRVLLTGHLGYLGTVMSPILQAAGHDVIGLDTGLYAASVLGPVPVDPPALPIDLRDVTAADLQGFDAVVHLAALSNDPLGALDPELTYAINHRASVALAEAAKEAGVGRFLYASTCSVYGAAGDGLVGEEAPLAPVTPYAESKVWAERDILAMTDSDFAPTALRNATAFGFSPRLRADIVLNNLVGHALLGGEILVLSDGTPWRPLVHAADIADSFAAVLAAPVDNVAGRALNVGDERNNVRVSEIAEEVARAVPGAGVRITGEAGADPRSYRVDFSALREALPGFACRRSVADGARELVAAYREFGLDRAGFENTFVRLRTLQARQDTGELTEDLRPAQP
ncbi:NAD-dependent epimerase/dehydratase family protein [Naumannella halotolerans]|uniref:NAD-dependent epimerase/dehydratase family protein n=1 Tax=Naumannella halotolerans TaxID=993414 RepID=UPI00370DC978